MKDIPEQVKARLAERMAEPVEETLRKARRILGLAQGQTGLMAGLYREYAEARIWHIKNGIPLPPFSNGNLPSDVVDLWVGIEDEYRLFREGNRQLLAAWKQAKGA